jgi:thymidylate synthase (FAD)
MNNIQVGVNYSAGQVRSFTELAAKVSQQGQKLKTYRDVEKAALDRDEDRLKRLLNLPHPSLQQFGSVAVIFTGVSRRFLAQITRHQNDVHFMVSSFRYADHSDDFDFVTPMEVSRQGQEAVDKYADGMRRSFDAYRALVPVVGHDAAGYALPNATRCTIMMSATPWQVRHMINQRTCRRCGSEMRYTMLLLWATLFETDPIFWSPEITGPDCFTGVCREGKMSCNGGHKINEAPMDILKREYKEFMEGKA